MPSSSKNMTRKILNKVQIFQETKFKSDLLSKIKDGPKNNKTVKKSNFKKITISKLKKRQKTTLEKSRFRY
jgi:hypothetical protein